MTFAALH